MIINEHYELALANGDIQEDASQRAAVLPLEKICQKLIKREASWLPTWFFSSISGLYLYGKVGVGKTFLMDLLFEKTPIKKKLRFHFHHFMQQVDAELRSLQGHKNPLKLIAENLAKEAKLLCFDEFLVEDVAHAMILAELLQILLNKGVTLVLTSNTHPDNLYLNGAHRKRFLPAIKSIKSHCLIYNLQADRDYRLGKDPALEMYLYPLGKNTDEKLMRQFESIEPNASKDTGLIQIQNRDVAYIQRGEKIIWFDFQVLCNLPRSQLDYLEIAEKFDTIFLSNVPVLHEEDTIYAILLIHLIDILYDRGIKLIISAAAPLEEIYKKGEMMQIFQRTYSRLEEMHSVDFMKRHHKHAVDSFSKN
jgi:cell division protein ZapE